MTDMTAAELDDLEQRLWDSDAASALTNQAARAFASFRKQLDEAREREATAIKRAARVAKEACLVPPDGGSPTEEECAVCDEAERRILALLPASPSPVLRDADTAPAPMDLSSPEGWATYRARERNAVIEECAKVAETVGVMDAYIPGYGNGPHVTVYNGKIAEAIRALASRPVSERDGSADTAPAPAPDPCKIVDWTSEACARGTVSCGVDHTAPAPAISGGMQRPERIWVEQDIDGFWTCREARIGSQEYIRADLAAPAISGGMVSVLQLMKSGGDWGKWLAWIVAGAPDRAMGVAAAKRIVEIQTAADRALATADRSAS